MMPRWAMPRRDAVKEDMHDKKEASGEQKAMLNVEQNRHGDTTQGP